MQLGIQAGIQLFPVFPVALWPGAGPEAATRDKNQLCFTLENWKLDRGQLFSTLHDQDTKQIWHIFYLLYVINK